MNKIQKQILIPTFLTLLVQVKNQHFFDQIIQNCNQENPRIIFCDPNNILSQQTIDLFSSQKDNQQYLIILIKDLNQDLEFKDLYSFDKNKLINKIFTLLNINQQEKENYFAIVIIENPNQSYLYSGNNIAKSQVDYKQTKINSIQEYLFSKKLYQEGFQTFFYMDDIILDLFINFEKQDIHQIIINYMIGIILVLFLLYNFIQKIKSGTQFQSSKMQRLITKKLLKINLINDLQQFNHFGQNNCLYCLKKLKFQNLKKQVDFIIKTKFQEIIQIRRNLKDNINSIAEIGCGHKYHYNCMKEFLNKKQTCCICDYTQNQNKDDKQNIKEFLFEKFQSKNQKQIGKKKLTELNQCCLNVVQQLEQDQNQQEKFDY